MIKFKLNKWYKKAFINVFMFFKLQKLFKTDIIRTELSFTPTVRIKLR